MEGPQTLCLSPDASTQPPTFETSRGTSASAGLVASHYPVLLDDSDELGILIHVGRADAEIHGFGSGEVLVIVAGPHGYISPS